MTVSEQTPCVIAIFSSSSAAHIQMTTITIASLDQQNANGSRRTNKVITVGVRKQQLVVRATLVMVKVK